VKHSGVVMCYNRKGAARNACESVIPPVTQMLSAYLLHRSHGAAGTKFEVTGSYGKI